MKCAALGKFCLALAALVAATARGEIVLDPAFVPQRAGPAAAQIRVPPPERGPGEAVEDDERDTIEFLNRDSLTGSLVGYTGAEFGLMWRNPCAAGPIAFAPRNLKKLRLAKRPVAAAHASRDTVLLTNGDELRGSILALNAEYLTLETWYAGRLLIKRPSVKAALPGSSGGARAVDGLGSLSQWTSGRGQSGGWEQRGENFVCYQSMPIGRFFSEMPDAARIDFTLSWQGYPQMIVSFFSDNIAEYGGNCYFLAAGHGSLAVTRSSRQTGHTTILSSNPAELQPNTGSARISLLADKRNSTVAVLLNGKPVGRYVDNQGFAGLGKGLVFYPQSNSRQRISDFRIAAWDGRMPDRAEGSIDASAGSELCLANGDRVSGALESITEGSVAFSTAYASMQVPVDKVVHIAFGGGQAADAERRSGDVRLLLNDGGSLTVRLDEIDNDVIKGECGSFGVVQIPLAACGAIAFNIYDEREDDDDDWLGF